MRYFNRVTYRFNTMQYVTCVGCAIGYVKSASDVREGRGEAPARERETGESAPRNEFAACA